MIDWRTTKAAVFRRSTGALRPIAQIDTFALDDLINVERQKAALVQNTDLAADVIVQKALEIAADICVFTNREITVETLGS